MNNTRTQPDKARQAAQRRFKRCLSNAIKDALPMLILCGAVLVGVIVGFINAL